MKQKKLKTKLVLVNNRNIEEIVWQTRSIEFKKFLKKIKKEHRSSADAASAIDKIAGFDPDNTLKLLIDIQPGNDKGYSVPQHCFPEYDDLAPINQESILPLIGDLDNNPISLYLHIPFCPELCAFCDYSSMKGTTKEMRKKYLGSMAKEIKNYYALTGWQEIQPKGIHIGGGTPTVLAPAEIVYLGELLKTFFALNKYTQLTFEASPITSSPEKLDAFKEIGASRASVGLQSVADTKLLKRFNRFCDIDKSIKSVEWMMQRWPNNTNIDMIYGLAGQSIESWERDINTAIELNVPSITFYELRLFSGLRLPEGQELPTLYETMLMKIMAIQKFLGESYIQSCDNQVVRAINDQPYIYRDAKKRGGSVLGLGLSSYSISPNSGLIYFNIGAEAKKNSSPSDIQRYSSAVEDGNLPIEIGRIMEPYQRMQLFMIQGLKLSGINKIDNGVDTVEFERRFKTSVTETFPHTKKLIDTGLIEIKDKYLGLTEKGLAFEDLILKTYFK